MPPTRRFDGYGIVSKVRFTARKFEASSMESTVWDTIFKNLGFARTFSKAPGDHHIGCNQLLTTPSAPRKDPGGISVKSSITTY